MANEDLDVLVADIYQGLGFHARAAMMRDGAEAAEANHKDCERIGGAIADLLDKVPANADRHTHTEDTPAGGGHKAKLACWRTRAQCLAEKLRGMIDDHA